MNSHKRPTSILLTVVLSALSLSVGMAALLVVVGALARPTLPKAPIVRNEQVSENVLPPELITPKPREEHTVLLEVRSTTRVSVDWRVGWGRENSGQEVLDSGFAKEFKFERVPTSIFLSATPVKMEGLDSPDVACKITVDGVVKDEHVNMFGGICSV